MQYFSTRDTTISHDFSQVLLQGLAPDGGLYLPKKIPVIGKSGWLSLERKAKAGDYVGLAVDVMMPYVEPVLTYDELHEICKESYATFHHPDIAPLHALKNNPLQILELFHGPTLAFKDFALQFLGRVFETILKKKNQHLTLIGATSGDTGSAAMAGCVGRDNIDLFVLYPDGRVSDIQRRQMTTFDNPHIHALAVKGSFDDCQLIVKRLFADKELRGHGLLSGVNSINWVRILAQMVYYIYGGLRAGALEKPVSFIVPTGNFGNVFAGFCAMQMGLPVDKFVIATNENDVLYRFFETGQMRPQVLHKTHSPSMDIQYSSNFERLLFYYNDGNSGQIDGWMKALRVQGHFTVEPRLLHAMQQKFVAVAVDDSQTLRMMQKIKRQENYLLDPHTAVGMVAAEEILDLQNPVLLATAHPAKFPESTHAAVQERAPLPDFMSGILSKTEKSIALPADAAAIKAYILEAIDAG